MGEVYRARDSELEREVAVKVLPEAVSRDSDRLARFEREAKAVAKLNHPNILDIHDYGRDDDITYSVTELLEGETLRERLFGGALGWRKAAEIGAAIADGLGAAHEAGIVHRDLKPSNVFLTSDGRVKVLDFGLARHESLQPGVEESDTTTLLEYTDPGTVLGTVGYMSTEQVRGQQADYRSDIFSLGCVLYEMVGGQRAFTGDSAVETMNAILKEEPADLSASGEALPPELAGTIRRCLEKQPQARFQSARDLAYNLRTISSPSAPSEVRELGGVAPVAARRKTSLWMAWAAFAVAAIAAALLAVGYASRAPRPAPPTWSHIMDPTDLVIVGSPRISPDGRMVAFRATDADGETRIWLRRLDSLEARPLLGTESSRMLEFRPIWSPDSRIIAFFADNKLKKIAVDGGPPVTICDTFGANGTWATSGEILYDALSGEPIYRVEASGGIPEPVVTVETEAGEMSVMWPEFLPDGRQFLYVARDRTNQMTLMLATLGSDGTAKLVDVDSRAQYAEPGYLLYVRSNTLVAQPFDARSGEITGEPLPIADRVTSISYGQGDFSASRDGTLVFRAGTTHPVRQLKWVDRSGRDLGTVGDPAAYSDIVISPDGNSVVTSIAFDQSGNSDVWVRDLRHGVATRLTYYAGWDAYPLWSPDGSRIVFSSNRRGPYNLYVKDASGSGDVEELLVDERNLYPGAWSANGKFLAYVRIGEETGMDIWALPMDPPGDPFPLVNSEFDESRPRFSPDGRCFSHHSDESGSIQVYVRPFPDARSRWQISAAGGSNPLWSADGKEIFYADGAGRLVSVQVQTGDTFTAGPPVVLFDAGISPTNPHRDYAVSPDGQRILLITPIEGEPGHLIVVQNWPALLDQ
jgi:Tol biopolymer transport system component